jgi:riboflavin synthase
MFTGLIQALGIVLSTTATATGRRLVVSLAELAAAPIAEGDSVCVSGVCLTAVRVANGNCTFDVVGETLRASALGDKAVQDRVNLELSLRPDAFIGGHFVQGHVDAVGTVRSVTQREDDWRIAIAAPADTMRYLVPKGSVAVDGVSMTIAAVGESGADSFTLAVIPTTLERTTLSALQAGDKVNIETDILVRSVVHFLERSGHSPVPGPSGVTLDKLVRNGLA